MAPFEWGEVHREWFLGEDISLPSDHVVRAFDCAERLLGRDWIDAVGANVRGPGIALQVVATGEMLGSIEDADGRDELLEKVRAHDSSALAELAAIHLLRQGDPDVLVHVGPRVPVGNRERRPDFGLRRGNEGWTYVEVTQPSESELQGEIQNRIERLGAVVREISRDFAIEVFFRREPTEAEVRELISRLIVEGATPGPRRVDVSGLCVLVFDEVQPGAIVAPAHPNESDVRRYDWSNGVTTGRQGSRHVVVHIPVSDDRAEDFLKRESKQLPKDAPTLVMARMIAFPFGLDTWQPLLRRRFQPTMHTRIGGVCLFYDPLILDAGGLHMTMYVRLIENPHATHPLADWIVRTLTRQRGS